jgi:hypothetical protein
MAPLPYVTAAGNVTKALSGIKTAATPERVSQDFVKTVLKIPGGSGDQMTSYLKKIGLAASDGSPTELYRAFRNPTTTGSAAAEALRKGYAPLFIRNEYAHKLDEPALRSLIIEETGQDHDASSTPLISRCFIAIRDFADFKAQGTPEKSSEEEKGGDTGDGRGMISPDSSRNRDLKLAYTINLNLPATSDVAVFNAIFKSLREHLLKD